jgi:DNA-binding IclR family transcriptional regulator
MPDEHAIIAISRIERALARIESAAGRAQAAPAPDGELEQLRQAHQALRGRVEGAITHIDQLLASGGERIDG